MPRVRERASLRPGGQDSFVVRHVLDSAWAGPRAARFAARAGLDRRAQAELAIITSELVTNAVKFAGAGNVVLLALSREPGLVELVVQDDGPGISDPESAVLDGYSEGVHMRGDEDPRGRRGLGSGLAAVKRLADELHIVRPESGGTRVIVRKGGSRRGRDA